MTISKNDLAAKKNLKLNKSKEKDILSNDLKNKIIQEDIADNSKVLDKDKLINTQKVSAGLKAQDAEYLQDVIDMDLYKEYNITFENLPKYRLSKEKAILKKGPTHLKGCTNWWARKKWKKKQEKRVKAADKQLKKHVKLLSEYDKYKEDRLDDIEANTGNITAFYANQEQQQQGGNVTEMLNTLNTSLARDAILNLNLSNAETANEVEVFLKNYEIDQDTSIQDRKKQTAKDQAKRKKKADKTGKIAADEEIIQAREELENELLDKGEINKERTLKTEVVDLEGKNAVQLKDMCDLFKKVLADSAKPFTEEKEVNGQIVQNNLGAQRYADVKNDANKVLNYATDLGIAVPEELYYLLKLELS